jgi:pimeloyl-ACP methyl ester carboxylesterase
MKLHTLIVASMLVAAVHVSTSAAEPAGEIRLTPSEIAALAKGGAGAGTSGVTGIRTTVLAGNPATSGPYTIEIRVPAHTRIQAHTHRDARTAMVVSGGWYFGYGEKVDDLRVKKLGPGSFYTEPASLPHFAMTRDQPAVVYISGMGPTDTIYNDGETGEPMRRTVVLVHGAFADGSSWNRVIPILQARGLDVVAVQNPLTSLADDVAATRRAMESARGPVVLVGHSWGGAVITQAGADEKVKALVYVAAFAPDAGQSVNDLLNQGPAPAWAASLRKDSGGFLTLPPETVAKEFAQDLTSAETKLMASTQGPWAERCIGDVLSTAAWRTKPSWYLLATDDHMIPAGAQESMSANIRANVTKVSASHVPMLSHPDEVAAVILAAADAIPDVISKE